MNSSPEGEQGWPVTERASSPACVGGGRPMPFRHVANQYQPEKLGKLTEAFDQAWPTVLRVRGTPNPDQINWLRQRLASYIIACAATQGDFDPVRLSESALRAFISEPDVLRG